MLATAVLSRSAVAAAAASTSRQVALSRTAAAAAATAASSSSSTPLLASAAMTRARWSQGAAVSSPARASLIAARTYASSGGPSVEDIEKRIKNVLTSFEKVKADAINSSASFTGDLGLDSLDAVEVVMAIEEEFNIEIPDEEADNITTVQQAIDYVSHAPEAV